jgi:hypothetical protein
VHPSILSKPPLPYEGEAGFSTVLSSQFR